MNWRNGHEGKRSDASLPGQQSGDGHAYSWYVVEETGIDGIVIWQAPTGDIFQTALGAKTRRISDSLAEYIIGNY